MNANLEHAKQDCSDPDCEIHHPEVIEEEAARLTAMAWFEAGARWSRRVDAEAFRLGRAYGFNPQEVGSEDGTEDDFGDLIGEIADVLDVKVEDEERWRQLQDAAAQFDGTTIHGLIRRLREATV